MYQIVKGSLCGLTSMVLTFALLAKVFNYLLILKDGGLASSFLKVHLAAIRAYLGLIKRHSVFSAQISRRFLKACTMFSHL